MNQKHWAWIDAALENTEDSAGLGNVVVLRARGPNRVEAGVFLVDPWCTGVRDGFYFEVDRGTLEERKEKLFQGRPVVEKDGPWARKYIEDLIAYGRTLGFAPHSDYKKAARVFGGIRAADCSETFTFGKDGKPMYVPSQTDDEVTIERIIARLTRLLGEGNFYYLLGVGGFEDFDEDADDEEDEDEDEAFEDDRQR